MASQRIPRDVADLITALVPAARLIPPRTTITSRSGDVTVTIYRDPHERTYFQYRLKDGKLTNSQRIDITEPATSPRLAHGTG